MDAKNCMIWSLSRRSTDAVITVPQNFYPKLLVFLKAIQFIIKKTIMNQIRLKLKYQLPMTLISLDRIFKTHEYEMSPEIYSHLGKFVESCK